MLNRNPETHLFVTLPERYLIGGPRVRAPPPKVARLTTRRLRIPSFQRGIVWDDKKVEDLLDTTSLTLGTIIVGQVRSEMPILVDGLQRFGVGTALLKALYPEVLSPNPRQRGNATLFDDLRRHAAGLEPIFDHNSRALRQHPRLVIRESYQSLEEQINQLAQQHLADDPEPFAERVQRLFLNRQVALDEYTGFSSMNDLSRTFIAMNTGGIELDSVDLLRSQLVDRAMERRWSASDVEDMENRFSAIFETNSGRGHVQALATALNEALSSKTSRAYIFPDWSRFDKPQSGSMLNFLEEAVAAGTDSAATPNFPYFRELYDCGPQAFTVIVLHFWVRRQAGAHAPDFAGGRSSSAKSLHLLLRAFYRRIIDGTIFRAENAIDSIMARGPSLRTSDVAEIVNPEGIGGLGGSPDGGWLESRIRGLDSRRSRRLFNACLLPRRSQAGGRFLPARYGNAANDWTVDHLIPDSRAPRNSVGGVEAQRLPNFAPFPSKLNSGQRAMLCSVKLGPGGYYPGHEGDHPFLRWLLTVQFPSVAPRSELDKPTRLVQGERKHIGDARISELARLLVTRL
jgi:hypothetical protein